MARLDLFLTSPLRGEVRANAPGEGFSAMSGTVPFTSTEPLTPALSPQGRGGEEAAMFEESPHGTA